MGTPQSRNLASSNSAKSQRIFHSSEGLYTGEDVWVEIMDQLSHFLLDLSLKFAKKPKVKTEELENWNQDESHTAKNGERAKEIHPLLGEMVT